MAKAKTLEEIERLRLDDELEAERQDELVVLRERGAGSNLLTDERDGN